eukprot:763188-Rhodomonas_salina.1
MAPDGLRLYVDEMWEIWPACMALALPLATGRRPLCVLSWNLASTQPLRITPSSSCVRDRSTLSLHHGWTTASWPRTGTS